MTNQGSVVGNPGGPDVYRCEYRGSGGSLFGLCLQNFIFRILTLGIYSPWAKTEFRKHVWQNTFLQGQALAYRGKGIEIFKGLCKLIAIYIGVGVVRFIIDKTLGEKFGTAFEVFVGIIFVLLVPRVILGARRYRLSRTSWRGIRFGLKPIEAEYTVAFVKGIFLSVITLGIYVPFMNYHLYKLRTEASTYGTVNFVYTGNKSEEFVIYLKGFIFGILTLGIYNFWFFANIIRYRASHTHFSGLTLAQEITAGDMFKMQFLCGLALLFTFGLTYPWIFTYRTRLVCGKTWAKGIVNFDQIIQDASSAGMTAEAASDFLDIDVGLTFDL